MQSSCPPRVSVVCPTYNRSTAIVPTLDSVRAQTVASWELLVVSDGSTDDTDDAVRAAAHHDPRIRLVRTHAHGGPSEPRNIGLAAARGEVVAYLDHDDRWREDHLEVVLRTLDAGADLVATGYAYVDEDGRPGRRSESYQLCWHPELQLLSAVFEPSRVAHRKGLAEAAGGWREVPGFEDWDLWQRMADLGLRFTTVTDRTAVLLDATTARRRTIRPRFRMPVLAFDDAGAARAALDELQHDRNQAALRAACVRDVDVFLRRLMATPDFVRPLGWAGDPVPSHVRTLDPPSTFPCAGLHVVRSRDGYALAEPLLCPTQEHADRIAVATRRNHAALRATFEELAQPFRRRAAALAGTGAA